MVSIENGAYRLTSITESVPGKLKLVFDFGSFEDQIYGKSNQLSGEIELFHVQESFPISNYYDMTEAEQNKLLEDAIANLRYMFDNMDEETLHKQMFSMIILAVMCFPRLDVRSSLFDLAVGAAAGGCMADDWVDDMDFFFDDVKEANRIMIDKLSFDWKKISSNSQENGDNVFTDVWSAVPESEKIQKMFADFTQKMRQEFPDGMPEGVKYLLEQFRYSAQSLTLGYKEDDPMAVSEDMQQLIRGYDAGFGPCADFAIMLQGQTVPKKIRNSLLFQLLFKGVMDFSGLINDVLGFKKDIKKEAASENHVLRRVLREKITLEQSFKDALKRLQNLISDLRIVMQRLVEAFPEEQGLGAYVQACKDFCDGQTVAYVIASQINYRYGVTTLEIASSSSD